MATKIVINKCFGGFGLSPKGIKRWAELKGRECYFFVNQREPFNLHVFLPVTLEEAEESFMHFAYDTPDPAEFTTPENWHELPIEERAAHNERCGKHSLYGRDIPRDDLDLIRVVEELGEAANGKHASLEIVEIPDGIAWEIDEYDGMEKVEEVHRSWG